MPVDTVFDHPLVAIVIAGLPLFGIISALLRVSFAKIAKWYLYITVFAVIIVMDSIFFPFIGGKDYFFRYCTELSLIAFVLWWAFEAKKGEVKQLFAKTFRKPLVIAVTAFAAAYLLACAFAYDAYAAFWSNFERGEGGFQMLHYYLFFILLVLVMKTAKDWKMIFRLSLVAAAAMIIYGIFGNEVFWTVGSATVSSTPITFGFIGPYAGVAVPATWFQRLIVGRFDGSLGNPAYVDAYLIFAMFYAVYLWIAAKVEGKATKWTPWGWTIAIILFLFFFIIGQTRGAFLGLAAGVFVLLLYLVVAAKGGLRKWSAIILGICVVLGIGLYAIRNIPAVQNLPEGRLLQISFSDTTAQTRFWVWGEAWKGFLEKPVFGWGPENFTTVFDKFFNPNFFVPGQNTQTWFDRGHSVFFDYLSETGIIGLLAYLSMFVVFFWEFFKKHKRSGAEPAATGKHGSLAVLQRGLILAVPVAYLVQGVAIFDVLPTYLSLFLFLAFSHYYFES